MACFYCLSTEISVSVPRVLSVTANNTPANPHHQPNTDQLPCSKLPRAVLLPASPAATNHHAPTTRSQQNGFRQPASVSPDQFCFTAKCMRESNACHAWSSTTYIFMFWNIVNVIFALCAMACIGWLVVHLVMHKQTIKNAAGTSLIFGFWACGFAGFWSFTYVYSLPTGYAELPQNVGFPLGIGGAGATAVTSLLNIGLMWYQVAKSSKTMSKTGKEITVVPLPRSSYGATPTAYHDIVISPQAMIGHREV